VTFTDGSSAVASQYHLWHVQYRGCGPWLDVATEDLIARVGGRRPDNGRMEYNWRVRADTVPQLPEADLPVDPYLLGYWLGDGHTASTRVTVGQEDYSWVQQRLYKAGARKTGWSLSDAAPEGALRPSATGHLRWVLDVRLEAAVRDGFSSRLKALGAWDRKKIPELYLTASVRQRKALLAGLMDTDGSITLNNKAPQCEFSTSSAEIAHGFHRLARSLGIKAVPRWRAIKGQDNCRFLFTAPFNPFEMPRKAARWVPPASKRHELMSIVSVEPVLSRATRCIKIASPDGVYLTGELFTPTHNTVLEIRELGGLFVLGEELIIHTSHEFKTSAEHFRRVKAVFDDHSALRKRVKRIAGSHGEEAIELFPQPTLIFGPGRKQITRRVAGRLRFLARSKGSGRGFSCDCLVYDEAMILSEDQVAASLPTMSARANPQIWYAGSAGNEDSFQFAAVRQRIVRNSKDLFGAEWSIDPHNDACPRDELTGRETNYFITCTKHDDRDDPRSWAKANPGYGYRISEKFTRNTEMANMPPQKFDMERLAVGKWPQPEAPWAVISEIAWNKLAVSQESAGFPVQPIVFALDIDEDGRSATISAAWDHPGSKRVVLEIPKGCSRQGTDWVLEKADRLYKKRQPIGIAIPKSGPAAALIPGGTKLWRERCIAVGTAEEAAAFAWLLQQVRNDNLWHFGREGAPTLWHAVATAATRVVGDGGKAWSRRDSESDITPVTSATLAAYVLDKYRRSYDLMDSVA
jgi:LAGLIDADG DNA endonuclease family protein